MSIPDGSADQSVVTRIAVIADCVSGSMAHQNTPSVDGDLAIVNHKRRILPGPKLLHELIAKPTQGQNTLLLDFVNAEGQHIKLEYDQFHHLTDRLARDIRTHVLSCKAGEAIIPAIIPQCPELYIAWVAVLKAGAAYCPVSLDVPAERLKFIVKDVNAPCILTLSANQASVQDTVGEIRCLSVSLHNLAEISTVSAEATIQSSPLPTVTPDNPAYVMYTSGSTGLPKGVKVSHLSVSQSLLAHDEHIPRFKRFFQFASPTFDVSIFEIFFPFFRGATLVSCERERMLSDLPGAFQALQADAAELTPTVAGTLLRTRKAAPSLELLLTIGEMLTKQVISEFGGSGEKPSILYAMYGPTEAAIHCTLAVRLDATASVHSIGRPLSTVTAFVLKEADGLEIARIGEPGELAVSGQLADGYLNRADQNSAAFVELPGYGSIYKTGDRAVCRPSGELEILGRLSAGQVKIRGQRVELGEIEEIASKAHGVDIAVASVVDDILVLFCAGTQAIDASGISAVCKAWLPSYMRPGEIVVLQDGIPRLPSGKIDRKTLEAGFQKSHSFAEEEDGPENEVERDILEVLRNELNFHLRRTTSLWSSGVDSLRSIKVASKLRIKYPNVSAAMIAEADTVMDLATMLQAEEPSVEQSGVLAVSMARWESVKDALHKNSDFAELLLSCDSILPCSSMQIAMLVESTTQSRLNFNEISVNIAPGVGYDEFRQAFRSIADQNEILRSGFISTGDQAMPFARVVWRDFQDNELSLLHPLQLSTLSPMTNTINIRIHHALYDGWSWDLILDDLNSILSKRSPPARTQFSDFYESQIRQATTEKPESLRYWRETLEGYSHSPFPNLSSTRSDHGEEKQKISVTSELSMGTQRLFDISNSMRCSRQSFLESAWVLLLSLYADTTDVAIGVVSAGRHFPMLGIETIIGPCLATLPLRIDLCALRTVHDVIDHIQRQHLDYLKYGSLSLLDIHRSAGLQPGQRLFDTLCVWQEDYDQINRDRSKVCTKDSHDSLDYTIVLEFEPRGGQLFMKMTFESSLLPEPHATLLSSQMNALVSWMVTDLERPLTSLWKDIDLSIMSLSNTNYTTFDEDFHLASTILELAQSDPERLAVEHVDYYNPDDSKIEKNYLTYGDLYTKASQVASTLTTHFTIQQDELVCILAPKSIELYVGILGVILAGAAYLCVDVRTPTERTRQILQQSKSRIILTDGLHNPDFKPDDGQVTLRISDAIEQGSNSANRNTFHPADSLAYAVFTSGSTGTPKGVLITRRNLLSNLRDLSQIYPSVPGQDKLLQACSPAFDVSVYEIFWTWHRGMTLCTASNDVLFRDIESLICELNVTHLSLTPSVAALVSPRNVPRVKMLVTAGEPMNSKVFSEWSGEGLYQGYGPSETTNICNVRPAVSQQDTQNNVGPALANTSLFVCKRQDAESKTKEHPRELSLADFQLLPRGAIGEIWIGGEQVGRGYIDPQLTAKSFFQHPVYGHLYRSGDIGRLLADDTLVITGREDDQVKLRGQRLELGDINSSLLSCEGVNDAVSMIVRGENGTDRLVSFWSAGADRSLSRENEAVETKSLFDQLNSILPTYMIPDTLLHVKEIPLTRQGKTDRRAVVEMYHGLSVERLQQFSKESKASEDPEPLSNFEKKLAEVIAQTLQVPFNDIKRSSSLFALGLDSISAIRLMQNLKKVLHRQMNVSTILQNPSINQLLSASGKRSSLQSDMHELQQLDGFLADDWKAKIFADYAKYGLEVESFRPCTPLQESMAVTSTNLETQAYQNVLIFRVCGDLKKLRRAWSSAMRRHQLLRTGFVPSDLADRPYIQVVLKEFELPWQDKHDQSSTQSNLDELMLPPWRIKIQQDNEGIKLVLEIHHVIYDAEAMLILQTEIQSAYYGEELPAPVKFDHYLSFMESMDPQEQDKFWQTQLQQSSACRLRDVLHSQDKVMRGTSSVVEHTVAMSLNAFKDSVRKLSTTSLSLLQSAWSRLLFCIFQRQDVCFGTVLSGRNLPIEGVERILGPCFNTTPTRVRLKHNRSSYGLCHDLQQINVDILPFQPSSLRRIQQQNSEDGGALFDTLILLQQNDVELDDNIWSLETETGDMEFPFILEICLDVKDDSLRLKLHSLAAKDHLLNCLLQCYDGLLRDMISFPHARAIDSSAIEEILPTFLLPKQRNDFAETRVGRYTGPQSSSQRLSETEERVVQGIRELKPGLPSFVYKDTTIYRLGLDSINAVQLAARLRKLNYTISSGDILEAMTIERIAACCLKHSKTNESDHTEFNIQEFDDFHRNKVCEEHSIDETTVRAVRPCTSTQSGVLSQFLRTNGSLYFNTLRLGLDKSIDTSKLKHSWTIVTSLHDMLRTGFVELDDPKYPFAMITYRQGSFELPWSRAQGSSALRERPSPKGLTTPPWHLLLTGDHSGFVLEVSMLHALYDAKSLDIILHDVACAYRGVPIPEPPPVNTAIANILSLSGKEKSQKFWAGLRTELCPTKFPDFNIFNNVGSALKSTSKRFDLGQSEFKSKCAQADTTLQAIFVAAWSRLLSAYTSQDHVTFGVVLSGRDFESDQDNDVVFPCINTVPFALHVSQNPTEMLKRATNRSAEILKHQYTPLSVIKRLAGVEGELFDTVLVLQLYREDEGVERPWRNTSDEASAEYALSLEVIPEKGKFLFQLTYREDVVPPSQAAMILDQYFWAVKTLLSAIDGAKTAPEENLFSIIPPKDRRIPTQVQFLHEFVEITAKNQPDMPALEFVTDLQGEMDSRETWSYAQLDRCGSQIAQLLIKTGVRTNDLVAVCFDKCPEASFSILGVLKAGCGYLAIDPSAPEARKSFILKDSSCKIVLTTHNKLQEFTQTPDISIIAVDKADWRSLPHQNPKLVPDINPQATCYCLYTSGTTGTPKGCLISHDSAVQAMLSFQRIFKGRWNSHSRWLQFASFHFDVSVLEQYWSWSVGICVTSVPRDILFEDLPGTISRLNITHLDLTPSLARLLTPEDVPSLCGGVFIVGGEQVRQEILDTWGDSRCLYNFYGPSEVTIGCTVHRNVPKTAKSTNIGQQWDNVGSFVLIPNTKTPTLRGGVGELCLSGPLVGKGYLNRPELTGEKFIMLEDYDTRVYRTGDLVRVLHDDSFEFLGRIDDQVKLRGQRLEIGEINHIIMSASPKLKDVATMVLKHPIQKKDQLVTFFCTEKKQDRKRKPTVTSGQVVDDLVVEIKNTCSDRLPSYMVPTYYLAVSVIPLTINNKLDQKSLKALFDEHFSMASNSPLNNELKSSGGELADLPQVIEVVASFLQISDPTTIQPSSRLFELGLDSVSAIGLSRAFKKRGYDHASVATILRYPSVIGLAQALSSESHKNDSTSNISDARRRIQVFADEHSSTVTEILAVSPDEISLITPCTPLQEGMISRAVSASDNKDTTYFSVFHYELGVRVDMERLEAVWKLAEQSIAILRTHFVSTVGGFAQVVLRTNHESGVQLRQLKNGKMHPSIPWNQYFLNWIKSTRSFAAQLPWRVDLITFGKRKYMSLQLFHGLYDGISLDLLLDKVWELYCQTEPALEAETKFFDALPYGPLSLQPNEKEFWISKLPTIARLNLGSKDSEEKHGGKVVFLREKLAQTELLHFCNRQDVTISAFFQAAWLYTLYQAYGVNPTIGVVVSGRALALEDAEDIVGPMFNTIPFAICNLPGKESKFSDLVQACHQFNVEALPFHHTPLRQVARHLGQDVRQGLFEVLFVFQKAHLKKRKESLWHEISTQQSSPEYPLNLEVEQNGDEFNITLLTKPEYVDHDHALELLGSYLDLIRDVEKTSTLDLDKFCDGVFPSNGQSTPSSLSSSTSIATLSDVSPWSEMELMIRTEVAQLASVPEDSLGKDSPTIFEIGLDSIEAMKLSARLRNRSARIATSAIMKSPTIAGIAGQIGTAALKSQREVQPEFPLPDDAKTQKQHRNNLRTQGIDLKNVQSILPVTPMQEGLLMEPDKYFNVLVYKIRKEVDVQSLQEAWKMVLRSEAILRTHFALIDDGEGEDSIVQYVTMNFAEPEIHSNETITDVIDDMKKMVSSSNIEGHRFHIRVVDNGGAGAFLVLGSPHALYDAWSLHLLHQSVGRCYGSLGSSERQPSEVSYGKHIQEVIQQNKSSEAKEFWQECLQTVQPSNFADYTAHNSPSSGRLRVQASSEVRLEEALKFCRTQGVTLQSLGLTVWTIVLAHVIGRLDVCFGVVLSGRTTESSDELIFPTFNTVVFPPKVDETDSNAMALKRVHDTMVKIAEHQHFPLRSALRISRSRHQDTRLFDTLFTFQKLPTIDVDSVVLYDEYNEEDSDINPPYPVNVEFEGHDSRLRWTIAFQEGLVDQNYAQRLLSMLDVVLSSVFNNPEGQIIRHKDDGVSICGLPCIKMDSKTSDQCKPSQNGDAFNQEEANTVSDTWLPMESQIRDVLSKVSKTDKEQISKSIGFYHLGLDSVSAIKVASLLRKEGIRLPVSAIVKAQTIEKMALAVTELGKPVDETKQSQPEVSGGKSTSLSFLQDFELNPNDFEEVLPATAGQTYMLDMWSTSNGRLFYPTFWLGISRTTTEKIRQAIDRAVGSFPMLRTKFVRTRQGDTLSLILKKEKAASYGLPWSIVVEQREKDHLITWKLHHALYDALSLQLMLSELQNLCQNSDHIVQANVNPKDFISKTRTQEDAGKEFWINYLTDNREVPTAFAKSSFETTRSEIFDPQVIPMSQLRAALRYHGITIQALFFAVYAQVYVARLQSHTRANSPEAVMTDVIIGIYLANRSLDIDNLTELAVPTFNLVPLRIRTNGSSMIGTAREVQRDLGEISRLEHCGVSMREIHGWTGIKVDTYVNFLALPENEAAGGEGEDKGDNGPGVLVDPAVSITHVKVENEMRDTAAKMKAHSPLFGEAVEEGLTSHDWCLPSIDIEAKVDNGYLGVGVFAPGDMLTESDADGVVRDIKSMLMSIS